MTDLEIMERAKLYIDKMANGINPLTGESIPDDELLNNVRISRCLFYVSGVLGNVIENEGKIASTKTKKAEFSLDAVDLKNVEYSETPIALSVIAGNINKLIDTETMKQISYSKLAQMLISAGMLEEYETMDGKHQKRPTEDGNKLGITVAHKVKPDGTPYSVVVYDLNAQHFVIDNL